MKGRNLPFVNLRRMSVPMPWWIVLATVLPVMGWRLGVVVLRLVRLMLRNPGTSLALMAILVVWRRYGWPELAVDLVVGGVAVLVWWWLFPAACDRLFRLPLTSWWRRLWVYRRQWAETMTLCGLVKSYDGGKKVPALLRVRCTYATDEVVLRMPRGQSPEVYHKAASDLAHSFGTRHCRVFSRRRSAPPPRSGRFAWLLSTVDRWRFRDRPRLVWLVFIRRDPLTQAVPAMPIPARPDFKALALGLREDMEPYLLRFIPTHLLVIGATRSGKGSVIWSLIRAKAVAVRSGLVRLWVIDPKGGMEMYMGRPMYERYEDSNFAAMADLLDEAIEVMQARQLRLRGTTRAHTPSLDEPLIVIIIDELACLVAYLQDTDLRKRITLSLATLLTQGAGLGVQVVGASQDPRMEVLALRPLFPTRIALRLNEAGDVDMVLSKGSRERGALCDQIPLTSQGTGFVVLDEQPEPARIRFGYVEDDEIRGMAELYPAPATPMPAAEPKTVPAKASPAATVPRQTKYRPTSLADGPLLPDSLSDLLNGRGTP